jgi:hypothetical protein
LKLSEVYNTDISSYEDFIGRLTNEINTSYYDKGFSPLSLANLIHFLRVEFSDYFSKEYSKPIYFRLSLPKNTDEFIEKKVSNRQNVIDIHLSYESLTDILEGVNDGYDYIMTLLEQIKTILNYDNSEFNNYLVVQMNVLVDICFNELNGISQTYLQSNLLKPAFWERLCDKSSVFNDYYTFYQEDKEKNKLVFKRFLNRLLKRCGTL